MSYSVSSSPASSRRPTATLREQMRLELQFDGPIPPHALPDLRAMARTFMACVLHDEDLAHWIALAQRNLKTEQRKLIEHRRSPRPVKRWRLKQCRAARSELALLHHEHARRAARHTTPRHEYFSPTAPDHRR